ncbi:hypothetical protein L596_003445 [Steinernema carpocapsae]|uniref:G-protein coupled receptors family 1 profile domain-containing protein n=1 Tax=Steinernema carpocapsae TaxID=34508 RepID=A0A4U8USE8_STECR|nr:hypothetical protein L596_003445 [Steinernema carpocapsae]
MDVHGAVFNPDGEFIPTLFDRHPFPTLLIVVLVTIMIGITLVGNLMVCASVFLVRKLRHQPANFLLVSLAVADLGVAIFVMPPALLHLYFGRWVLGSSACRFWTTADMTLCTASIANLCMICVDRYLAVCKPLHYTAKRTRKRVLGYVAIVWIIALLVSIAPVPFLVYRNVRDTCQVPQNMFYQIYATVIAFYAPAIIMVTLYVRMWLAAQRICKQDRSTRCAHIKASPAKSAVEFDGKLSIRKIHRPSALLTVVKVQLLSAHHTFMGENKARKTLGVIMSVFIVCWLPFFIIALVKSQRTFEVPQWLDFLSLWLGYSNSMLNPLIYCKYNREFRIPFREMLCCRFSTLQTVMRQESFTNKFGPVR